MPIFKFFTLMLIFTISNSIRANEISCPETFTDYWAEYDALNLTISEADLRDIANDEGIILIPKEDMVFKFPDQYSLIEVASIIGTNFNSTTTVDIEFVIGSGPRKITGNKVSKGELILIDGYQKILPGTGFKDPHLVNAFVFRTENHPFLHSIKFDGTYGGGEVEKSGENLATILNYKAMSLGKRTKINPDGTEVRVPENSMNRYFLFCVKSDKIKDKPEVADSNTRSNPKAEFGIEQTKTKQLEVNPNSARPE
jgi:hypothetical protein